MKKVSLYFSLFLIFSCQQKESGLCHVVVSLKGTSLDSAILRRLSPGGGSSKKIDSGLLRFTRDSLVFELPVSADSLYQVSLKFSGNNLMFIPDCLYIRIVMDTKTGRNNIIGSPASTLLFRFNEEQDSLIRISKKFRDQSVNFRITDSIKQADSMQNLVSHMYSDIQQRYSNFADTVSSAVLFLINYDRIDFQNDFGRMKTQIIKASERFPNSIPIQKLKTQVLNLVHIYETELNAGDSFPVLRLPGLDGGFYSTDSARGKYVFIDFWSSWCQQCLAYNKATKELLKKGNFKNLVLIHVAMDDHLDLCRKIVAMQESPGIRLIDKDMWQGQTASKLAFDSIPFNYLLGPDQRILTKAVPADSLSAVIHRFIH
jgi:hypothetical protein